MNGAESTDFYRKLFQVTFALIAFALFSVEYHAITSNEARETVRINHEFEHEASEQRALRGLTYASLESAKGSALYYEAASAKRDGLEQRILLLAAAMYAYNASSSAEEGVNDAGLHQLASTRNSSAKYGNRYHELASLLQHELTQRRIQVKLSDFDNFQTVSATGAERMATIAASIGAKSGSSVP